MDPDGSARAQRLHDQRHVRILDYARASELFEAAIILERPTTSILNALAACHAKLGNLEKAAAYLEQSLELDPEQEKVKFLIEQIRNSHPR